MESWSTKLNREKIAILQMNQIFRISCEVIANFKSNQSKQLLIVNEERISVIDILCLKNNLVFFDKIRISFFFQFYFQVIEKMFHF